MADLQQFTVSVQTDPTEIGLAVLLTLARMEHKLDRLSQKVANMTAQDNTIASDLQDVVGLFKTFLDAEKTHDAQLQTQIDALIAQQNASTSPDPGKQAVIDALVALKQSMTEATAAVTPAVSTVSTVATTVAANPASVSASAPAAASTSTAPAADGSVPIPVTGTTGQVGADPTATAQVIQPGSPSPTSSNS